MDRKSLARRLGALIIATAVVMGIFILRLVQFQLVQGEELLEKALGDEKPDFPRPGDLLEPGWEKAKEEAGSLPRTEEDVLTYALFPNYAVDFLKNKYQLS